MRVIPGSWLLWATPVDLLAAEQPTAFVASFEFEDDQPGRLFGYSVALVPNVGADGRAGILVGTPLAGANPDDVTRLGAAELYTFDLAMLGTAERVWTMAGESARPNGRLGHHVTAGIGPDGARWFVIGANDGQGAGLDTGSSYPFRWAD